MQAAYCELFGARLDSKAIDDIRLALNQNQPLGHSRFYARIESVTGQRRKSQAARKDSSLHGMDPEHS